MPPPKFGDLSKAVTDLFNDDFGFGSAKLVLKSKAQNGVNFKVEASKPLSDGAVSAFLETKFSHSSGLSVKEKWTTKNDVTTELSVDNKVFDGSKFTGEIVFNPNAGLKDLKLKCDYAQDHLNANATLTSKGVVSASGVFGFGGKFLFGSLIDYDTGKGVVASSKFAVGFSESDFQVVSSITDGSAVEGSVFHTPSTAVQTGLRFNWSKTSSDVGFELCGKYKVDGDAFVKAKLDRAFTLGLSYTQKLRAGVSLTLATSVKAGNLGGDGHQLGLSLTMEQ